MLKIKVNFASKSYQTIPSDMKLFKITKSDDVFSTIENYIDLFNNEIPTHSLNYFKKSITNFAYTIIVINISNKKTIPFELLNE